MSLWLDFGECRDARDRIASLLADQTVPHKPLDIGTSFVVLALRADLTEPLLTYVRRSCPDVDVRPIVFGGAWFSEWVEGLRDLTEADAVDQIADGLVAAGHGDVPRSWVEKAVRQGRHRTDA